MTPVIPASETTKQDGLNRKRLRGLNNLGRVWNETDRRNEGRNAFRENKRAPSTLICSHCGLSQLPSLSVSASEGLTGKRSAGPGRAPRNACIWLCSQTFPQMCWQVQSGPAALLYNPPPHFLPDATNPTVQDPLEDAEKHTLHDNATDIRKRGDGGERHSHCR